jgi:hypothetical protein
MNYLGILINVAADLVKQLIKKVVDFTESR